MIGVIIAVLANLAFVSSNAMFRKVEDDVSPIFINMFRTGVGLITFIIFSLILGIFNTIFSLPWTLWIILIISFVFGQVIGDTFYFKSQKQLGTTKALAISMTFPFFTFILDLLFLERPFEIFLIPSAILISIGILIISKYKIDLNINEKELRVKKKIKNFKHDSKNFKIIPSLFAIFASLGWALGLIMIDYATNEINRILFNENLSSVVGNVIRFPFALALLSIMVKKEKTDNNLEKKSTWLWLISASIIGTSMGVYFFTEAARIAGASVMSLIASANPLFALPISYMLNKEKISKKGFIGVMLTIIGVILIII
ncbi:MAG: EamA-like transporter family protein [Promethearchaeota archaeon]|nr:MAG: EamA-like transporter family protein [Candidatus Lokiarchaeota archaeon]